MPELTLAVSRLLPGNEAMPWWYEDWERWLVRLGDRIACDKSGHPRIWETRGGATDYAAELNCRSGRSVRNAGEIGDFGAGPSVWFTP